MATYPWKVDPWLVSDKLERCGYCGKDFEPKDRREVYCCADCRRKGTKAKAMENLTARAAQAPSPAAIDPALRLAAAICAQAVEDLRGKNKRRKLEAFLWLGTDEACTYFEALGLSDPLATMNTNRLRKARRRE